MGRGHSEMSYDSTELLNVANYFVVVVFDKALLWKVFINLTR